MREVKRAMGVKGVEKGIRPSVIRQRLNVSPQEVSQWKATATAEGVAGLVLGYQLVYFSRLHFCAVPAVAVRTQITRETAFSWQIGQFMPIN